MENAFSITPSHVNNNAEIDVIFIHGLTGRSGETWGSPPSWLAWISAQCDANVFVADYPSKFLHSASEFTLLELGRLFDDAIESGEFGRRPIAFVVHSLGGILLKQALQLSVASNSNLAKLTKYVCFIATPHKGSSFANLLSAVTGYHSALVEKLKPWSEDLAQLLMFYRDFAASTVVDTSSFYEKIPLGLQFVVDRKSADPEVAHCSPIAISADHRSICKPTRPDATVFAHTRKRLQILARRYTTEFAEAKRYRYLDNLAKQRIQTKRISPNKFSLVTEVVIGQHSERLKAYDAQLITKLNQFGFVLNGQNCVVKKASTSEVHRSHIENEIEVDKTGKRNVVYDMEVLATPMSAAKLELLLLADERALSFKLAVPAANQRSGHLADAVARAVLQRELRGRLEDRLMSVSRDGRGVLEHVDLVRNESGNH